jgi:hypothetical protein
VDFTSRRYELEALFAVLFTLVVGLFGCGGEFSPSAPSDPQSLGTGLLTTQGQAVVQGQAVQGSGSGSSMSTAAVVVPGVTVGGLEVTVEGTDISDRLDANGNFRLVNVPSGNIKLRFTGTGVNAQLALQGIGLKQQLNIKVQVQAAAAQLLADERHDLVEFDAAVDTVDRFDESMLLADGVTVKVNEDTWWDTGGDVLEYNDLADAVEGGSSAKVEGLGTAEEGGFILATVIKAEVDDAEFENVVASVDRLAQSLTLVDGTVVVIGDGTIWDEDGDILDFATLADLVDGGNEVKVEGEGARQSDGSILATTIKAEVEEVEFEGLAVTVGLGAQSITLDDGTVVVVDSETVWDPSGNLFSLAAVSAALTAAGKVEIEGEGYYQFDGSILANRIKAKLDDDDDTTWIDYSAEIASLEALIIRINELAGLGAFDGVNLNSLLSTLQNTIKDLEKGHGTPAVGKLGAFINKVESLVKTGAVESTVGAELIAKAREIIAAIGSKS